METTTSTPSQGSPSPGGGQSGNNDPSNPNQPGLLGQVAYATYVRYRTVYQAFSYQLTWRHLTRG